MIGHTIFAWLKLLASILLGAVGQIFLKIAADTTDGEKIYYYINLSKNLWIYCGVAAYFLSFVFWLSCIRIFDIGFARPITSMGYILTLLLAALCIGEDLSIRRLIGTVVIMAGVVLLK